MAPRATTRAPIPGIPTPLKPASPRERSVDRMPEETRVKKENEAEADADDSEAAALEDDHVNAPTTFHGALEHFACRSSMSTRGTTQRAPDPSSARPQRRPTARSKRKFDAIAADGEPLSGTRTTAIARRAAGMPPTTAPTPTSTPTASSTPPKKRGRRPRAPTRYAPPAQYAHLPLLPDALAPDLICVFVGVNPGLRTAQRGHAYAHPSNLFWKLLHWSGCTARRCAPDEDGDLPPRFGLGHTNIVARPTRDQAELSRAEMVASVARLRAKVRRWRPEAVCLVGKGIWESVWRARYGRALRRGEFAYGWQPATENLGLGGMMTTTMTTTTTTTGTGTGMDDDRAGGEGIKKEEEEDVDGGDDDWKGARVFVATSTSGLAASTTPEEKIAIWKPLGEWVCQRRRERGQWLEDHAPSSPPK